ncbi:hypothetical protein RO3G_15624 [Rhizopus delemar RA 99-880]|uniref:Uncharacterized protein n=1 Tax=Rhizopus delemar (strain RA 99-880 / ATCC MYA-4621 / FGSC 9543 / NRRL 43880) TaxID=246409 RepID=I1CR33_RHIO9|nr:hypothetical protein RO3G_15624 [Rhizopus delemar RA 99-880]|eukprot:EIE90913.1 hypothetical protein RO3G_15624 [Rhizopus delemar RA 99-880]
MFCLILFNKRLLDEDDYFDFFFTCVIKKLSIVAVYDATFNCFIVSLEIDST